MVHNRPSSRIESVHRRPCDATIAGRRGGGKFAERLTGSRGKRDGKSREGVTGKVSEEFTEKVAEEFWGKAAEKGFGRVGNR